MFKRQSSLLAHCASSSGESSAACEGVLMVPHIWGALGATSSPACEWDCSSPLPDCSHCAFTQSWCLCNGRKTFPLIPMPFPSFLKKRPLGKPFSLLLTERLFLGGTEGTGSPERARPGARCGLGFGDTVQPGRRGRHGCAQAFPWGWPGHTSWCLAELSFDTERF